MRHRIKKIPSLIHSSGEKLLCKQSHLLHSDKGTYFYKDRSRKVMDLSHSNSMLRTIPLVLPVSALLLVLGLMISPIDINSSAYALDDIEVDKASGIGDTSNASDDVDNTDEAHEIYNINDTDDTESEQVKPLAASTNAKISFSIKNNGKVVASDGEVATEVTAGVVNYINNTLEITTTDINRFYVSIQTANGESSKLIGERYKQEILPVAVTEATPQIAPAKFGDNTWGFALSNNASATGASLTYKPLPEYNVIPPIQYTSEDNLANGTHTLALIFAAKINANMPSDHYKTTALISVVADAKDIY